MAGRDDLATQRVARLLTRLRRPEASVFQRIDDEEALRVLKVLVLATAGCHRSAY